MSNSTSNGGGYGRPPRKAQFAKGQSGNPNGRPRRSKNIPAILEKVLDEKVVITENGQRRKISKREASLKQLVNKAAGGDARAMQQIATLSREAHRAREEAASEPGPLDADDQAVLNDLLERMRMVLRAELQQETKSEHQPS